MLRQYFAAVQNLSSACGIEQGFSNYGSWPPKGVAKCNFVAGNQLASQIRCNNFCKIFKKIESRPAVNLSAAFLFLKAISYFMLSVVCYDACLSYQTLIKTRHKKLCVVTP